VIEATLSRRGGKRTTLLLPGLLAIAGPLIALYATAQSAGVSPDSVVYIAAARNLAAGAGLSLPDGLQGTTPMTHYPPLLPWLLAMSDLMGVDPAVGGRWLNAGLLGLTGFVVGAILAQAHRGSCLRVLLGTGLYILFDQHLLLHTWVLSEPLYFFFSLSGLYMLSAHVAGRRAIHLFLAGAGIGLAMLTRYVGVALLPVGVVAILWPGKERLGWRLRRASLFGALTVMPVGAWLLRNALLAGNPVNRSLVLHPVTAAHLTRAIQSLSLWLLPGRVPDPVAYAVAIAAIVAFIALAVRALGVREEGWAVGNPGEHTFHVLPYLLLAYMFSYALTLALYISLLDVRASFHERLVAPLFGPALIVTLILWPRDTGRRIGWASIAMAGLAVMLVGLHGARAGRLLPQMHEGRHLGYASRGWRDAGLIAAVKKLPPDVLIYSNAEDAIYFLTGRAALRIPDKVNPFSGRPNPRYREELLEMERALVGEEGVLVYSSWITWRGYLPAEDELREALALIPMVQEDAGTIYRVSAGPRDG